LLVALVLGMTMAAGWCAVAADDPPPKMLTPDERKELEARWEEFQNAGVKHAKAGKLAEATAALEKALETARRLYPKQDHLNVAYSLSWLGYVLHARARPADAEPLYRELVEMHRRLYPKQDHLDLAGSLTNLASVLSMQRKYADAEPLLRDALEMNKRLFKGDHPAIAESLHNLAGLLMDQMKLADAELLYREPLRMNKRLFQGDNLGRATALENLALVLALQDKNAEAELLIRERLDMQRRLVERNQAVTVQGLSNCAYALMSLGKAADAEPVYRDALDRHLALAGSYARQKSEGDVLTLLASISHPWDGYLSNGRSLKSDPVSVYPRVWASKAAVARVFEQRQLGARVATDPNAASILADLSTARRRRADLLSVPVSADPGTRKKRDRDLKELADTIAKLDRDLRPLLPAVDRAEKLAKATPADLQTALAADATVVDFLRYTLFEYDPKKPGKVREKQTVSYLAFVVTKDKVAWIDLGPAKPIEDAVAAWREAITGGKDIPPEVPAKVRGLVWAKVRKEIPDKVNVVYVSPDLALCRVPWAALPGDKPNTILIGAGALSPLVMTGLVFAGANKPNTPGRGMMTGEALVDLDLSGLDLAVLSACETGLGDVAGGEGTFGLQRAFHLAGTRDVVATLWKVPDQATAALMAVFYRNLWEQNMPPAEALRRAQLEIYRHPGKVPGLAAGFRGKFEEVPGTGEVVAKPGPDGKAHPRLWAAFTLSGPGR
jgi:tetratricopeptide (TPR) repeat protein